MIKINFLCSKKKFNEQKDVELKDKSNLNYPWYSFNLLIFITSLFFTIKYHNYYVLFFTVISFVIFVISNYKNWKKIMIVLLAIAVLVLLYLYIPFIYENKEQSWVWILRNTMIDHISCSYTKDTSDFILMLMFGVKNNHTLQNKINFLNIAQLFVVSGLHLQVFVDITKKLIKNKKINLTITVVILCFISYMTKFSISSERVIFLFLLNLNHHFKELDIFQKTSINGIIIYFLNPLKATSYSFIMVHIALYTIGIITMYVSHKYLKWFLINLLVYLSLMPIVVNFNGIINLLSLLFSFIFSPLIIALYFFILVLGWIPHFVVVEFLVHSIIDFIDISFSYQQTLKYKFPIYLVLIFYLLWCYSLTYLYSKKNYKVEVS